MGAHNSEGSMTNFYTLKAKSSDTDPTAFFGKNTKINGTWGISEKFNSFNGNLVDIKHSTYEYEGQTKHKAELTFKDKDGTKNVLSANYSNLLYSLLNSLASCEPEFIEMNLSLGKAKVIDGKAGKQFPSIWAKNNGEKIEWKYKFEDQPKGDKVKVGTQTVTDDSKVVEFWSKVIDTEIKPKLKAEAKNAEKQEATAETFEPIADNSNDGSLPF